MEQAGLPFAPIRRPEDLYDDEHLLATGGLADVRLPDGPRAGETVKTTLLPFTLAGERLGVRLDPPVLGAHSRELLQSLGLKPEHLDEIARRSLAYPPVRANPRPIRSESEVREILELAWAGLAPAA